MARSAAQLKVAILGELDENDSFEGLTSRQQMFVTLSFSGLNDTEAYRVAFETLQPSTHAVQVTAHHPLVVAKLKQMVAARDKQSTLSAWLTKDWILGGIANLAQTADKDSTRLAAFVALGKTAGIDLFRETVRHEQVTRSVEDVEQELKAKLDTMRASLTIEGDSRPAAADSGQPAAKDRRRKPKA